MEIISIESEQSSILYQKAQEIHFPLNDELKSTIEQMRQFYISLKNKAGFAAPTSWDFQANNFN